MHRILTTIVATLICAYPGVSHAQDVIDIFENQDDMPEAQVAVDGADGPAMEDLGIGGSAPGGSIRMKFDRTDNALLVETVIEGTKAYMIFDTGATTTSISTAFVRKIGAMPPADAPTTRVSTANGTSIAKFGILKNLTLGGRIHSGVTFATCDGCPVGQRNGRPIVGLLGLNVLNRYRYSIDESTGVIELTPVSNFHNRMRDVRPWLRVSGGVGAPAKKLKTEINFKVDNKAPRTVREIVFQVTCASGKTAKLEPVRIPAKKATTVKQVIDAEKCRRARIQPLGAVW